ncbi:unnamed protein product [Mytilus coruscus]|uniref:Uncharacterized protein n=1 Tax=Mytilus coruscus TaxID=42192 RepID=A0A6J8CS45_MYTCO|nr:unnamed protein product [Mytilus coruscus]
MILIKLIQTTKVLIHHTRRRAPSKKQKRKRRDKRKIAWDYHDPLPYINDNIELSGVKEYRNERDLSVRKKVPSLAELCLMSSKGLVSESNTLCKAFRKLYCDIFTETTFHKDQLKWLFYVLSCLEQEEETEKHLEHRIIYEKICESFNTTFFITGGDNNNDSYSHVTSTVCLPNYFLLFNFTNRDVDASYVSSLLGLSAFATAIDSMLPASYIEPKRYSTLKGRVKHILQKRFPVGTTVCFDIAMPYVYWARGELKLATDHFLALVQTEKRVRIKALYLNELARLHAQVGEGDLAARFYRMASDVAQEKFRDCLAADQISGQTQMLQANLNDQGILNEEKARKSRNYWKSIISSPISTKKAVNVQVSKRCYVSMVTGGQVKSCHGYKSDFQLPYCYTIPNDIKITTAMRWGCLTSFHTKAIPHLRIMWRTQLCHPSYVSNSYNGIDSDFCNTNLHLRLNPEGCITGDMQMYLPPIRAVCLNPYTGCLTFNSIPGKTESWISDRDHFYIPTLCEVYRDEDGITVHMKHPSFTCFESYYRKNTNKFRPTHSMVLNWRNSEGLTEKFNLFWKIQDVLYKETKTEILQKVIPDKENPQQYKQDALKYLDFAYKHGCSITIDECMQAAAFLRCNEGKLGKNPEKYYQMTSSKIPTLQIWERPVIYGKCLLFLVRYGNDHRNIIRVIIRCADRESFKSPIIHKLYLGRISMSESYTTVGAKLAWCIEHGQPAEIILFNQRGEIHEQFPLKSIIAKRQSDKVSSFCIMGENFVYIDKDDRMCIRQEHENTTIANLTDVKEILVVNADVCIVQESSGVCVFNIRNNKCLKLNLKIKESIERGILEKDEYVIHLPPDITIGILKTKMIKTVEKIIYKIVLHAETFLLVLEISEQQSNQFYEASVTIAIHLPGYPTDFCFVSRNGQLLGTIPFLGDSPFSFSPVFLDGDPSIQEKYPGYGTAGWYVYMRDGHGGILCVKLLDFY